MKPLPFERSYWVDPGRVLAGYHPGAGSRSQERMEEDVRHLLDCGIRSFVNLLEPDELEYRGVPFLDYEPVVRRLADGSLDAVCRRIAIRDADIPQRRLMVEALDFIDASLAENRPVYVHCWAGRGRTGTVVGCWLIRHDRAEGAKALERIRELRRFEPTADWPSPENPSQARMVLSWEKGE